jgi:protein associated with RNAse G/E
MSGASRGGGRGALRPVRLESRKYGGVPHRFWDRLWEVPATGSLVLWGPRETPVREADGRVWAGPYPVVMFFPQGRDWNAVALIQRQGPPRYYCNVCLPPERAAPDVWAYVDLDLDVLVAPDLSWEVRDREEFAINARRFAYPPEVMERAEAGLADLLAAIRTRRGPFARGAVERWYTRIRGRRVRRGGGG